MTAAAMTLRRRLRRPWIARAGVIVLPILASVVAYWRNGGFEPEEGLFNADEAAGVEPSPVAPP